MNPPTSPHDRLSTQTVSVTAVRPDSPRTIQVRLNLRIVAAFGAGLIVLAAFLPWIDPAAQALAGETRLAPVIQGWPSLLIGLIALGVLALPHGDSGRWVSLPVASLGLAAAVIAVASAMSAATTLAEAVARFPPSNAVPTNVTGAGVFLSIIGGVLCIIVGLAQPATSAEARLDLRSNQPAFSVLATAFVLTALIAGIIGWWLGSSRSQPPPQRQPGFPAELLSTPVIDVQVTRLATPLEPSPNEIVPTLAVPPTETPPAPTPIIATATATLFQTATSSLPSTSTSTPTPSPTSTPTATFPSSPLNR